MTGTHPEYPSEQMLDAYEAYVGGGGRLMYMGGNGMYWVTGYDPDDPQVIEIRRWGATQAWCAAPGEYHLSFTGRLGGAWRFSGRAPQKTFGVGFVAAGPAERLGRLPAGGGGGLAGGLGAGRGRGGRLRPLRDDGRRRRDRDRRGRPAARHARRDRR